MQVRNVGRVAVERWLGLVRPPVTAVVRYGEPQLALGRDRRSWARDLRSAVDQLRRGA